MELLILSRRRHLQHLNLISSSQPLIGTSGIQTVNLINEPTCRASTSRVKTNDTHAESLTDLVWVCFARNHVMARV
jgi:hypothetical protein